MQTRILVLNCGSSSVRYKVYLALGEDLTEQAGGKVEVVPASAGKVPGIPQYQAALDQILERAAETRADAEVCAVGHRVVHAGGRYTGSIAIDDDVVSALEDFAHLAPLHNPPNLAGIHSARHRLPWALHVACFDNALHHSLPDFVTTYALPYELATRHGVRRYGFHGLAQRSALERAALIAQRDVSNLKIVTLMLGGGCTAIACKNGQSFEVSTGFTPLEGLVQATRAGDVDAGAVLYLMEQAGLTLEQMNSLLNEQSGWAGIWGGKADFRALELAAQQGDARARLALGVFVHRARKYLGAYAAAMGGLDLLIFAGGVGEASPTVRERVCAELGFMGLTLDQEGNQSLGASEGIISAEASRVQAVVVRVDEELVIARDTLSLWRARLR